MIKFYFLIWMLLGCSTLLKAQNLQFEAYSTGEPQFNSYNDLMLGLSTPQQVAVSVRYYGSTPIDKWMVTVKLDGDFHADGYSVAAENAALQYKQQLQGVTANISIPTSLIPLNKYQEIPILTSESIALTNGFNQNFLFDLYIKGGNHLLTIPNKTYRANYIFTLYKIVNNVPQYVATSSSYSRFQINYVGNHGDQLVSLQNGATHYQFVFNNTNDIVNGLTIKKDGALRVKSYQAHELILKSSKEFMQSSQSNHQIPVSVIQANLNLRSQSGGQGSPLIFTPITLQVWDQVVARFNGWSDELIYDLTLSVPGNQPELIDAKGTYDTYLYFVIVPL